MCVCVPSIFICLCVYAGICPRKDFIMHMYLNTHNNRRGCIWTTFCSFASHCSASVASVARWGLYLHTHWHFLLKLLTSVVTSARDATSRWFSIIKHSYFSSLSPFGSTCVLRSAGHDKKAKVTPCSFLHLKRSNERQTWRCVVCQAFTSFVPFSLRFF